MIGIKGPVSISFKKKNSKNLWSRQPHLWQTGTEILHKLNQVFHSLNNLEFIKLTFPIIINSGMEHWLIHEWLLEGCSPQRLPGSRAPSCSRGTAFSPIEHLVCYCVCFCIFICMCKQARCPVDLGGVKADEHGGGTLGKIICLLSLLSTFCPKEIEEKNITWSIYKTCSNHL